MDVVLIHGAYHGSWCWERIVVELGRRGHRALAVDLPVSDPTAGADRYAEVAIAALDASGFESPMVVAHSLGGIVAPIVAARRPVEQLVFIAALLPVPGLSLNEQRERERIDGRTPPAAADWTDLGQDVWEIGAATAVELFFGDATDADATWATARLRPQCYLPMRERTPLVAWPDVRCASIVCRDDRALDLEWARSAARQRLGVEPIEIDGAHSPFLTRPVELAAILDGLTD